MAETSTKPYLLRALYEWCTDNGYTPYIVVVVDGSTRVPMEFVKNGEIVLNISFDATSHLKIDNDFVHFRARFGGVSRDIEVPIDNVSAIYARENGQGMGFDVQRDAAAKVAKTSASKEADASNQLAPAGPTQLSSVPVSEAPAPRSGQADDEEPEPPKKGGRPTLTRIK
ncbi:MAG: hypothetical protein RL717_2099 [Pseudomonadota bacterium]